nr:LysM peptidoglycan-binding domain-containing protein [Pseudoclavibacter chungangensis]
MSRTLRGVAAIVVLAGLLVGVPVALTLLAGNPLAIGPGGLLGGFVRPDLDGSFLMGTVLPSLGWLAWAYFTVSVVVEGVRLRTPRRSPAHRRGPGPALAALLLGAIVLLGTAPVGAGAELHVATAARAGTTLSSPESVAPPPSGDASPHRAERTGASERRDVPSDGGDASDGTPTRATSARITVAAGDSLWNLAARHLGAGERYVELLELNEGVPQADSGRLGSDLWLEAGWVLLLPDDAVMGADGEGTQGAGADLAGPDESGPRGAEADARDVPGGADDRRVAASTGAPQRTITVDEGDTLWDLAEEHYADGTRYPEIAAANDIPDPDRIEAGTRLVVPGLAPSETGPPADDGTPDTTPTDDEDTEDDEDDDDEVADGTEDADADDAASPPPANPSATSPAAPTEDAPTEDDAADGTQDADAEPTTTAPAASAGNDAADASTSASAPEAPADDEEPQLLDVRTAGGIGGVLAAGILGWLAVRRQLQRRRRRPGERIPSPDAEALAVEQELHAVDDGVGMEVVDLATRTIAVWAQDTGADLPAIYAVRLAPDELSVYLELPARLPAPFVPVAEDGAAWAVDPRALVPLERIPSAPYPALVTLGQDAGGAHLLVDLEQLGALDVHGSPALVDGALAAIAIELVTSAWCEDLQVTLVGIDPGLPRALDTGRLRHVDDVGALLRNLRGQAADTSAALDEIGAERLGAARGAGPDAQPWMPEIVLIGTDLDEPSRAELAELATAMPRLGIAAVARGRLADTWVLDLARRADAALVLPGGAGRIPLDPQLVSTRDRDRLARLAASTTLDPLPAPPYSAPIDGLESLGTSTEPVTSAPVPTASDAPVRVVDASDTRDAPMPDALPGWPDDPFGFDTVPAVAGASDEPAAFDLDEPGAFGPADAADRPLDTAGTAATERDDRPGVHGVGTDADRDARRPARGDDATGEDAHGAPVPGSARPAVHSERRAARAAASREHADDVPVDEPLDAEAGALLAGLARVPWVRLLGPVALHGAAGEPPRTPKTSTVNNSSVNRATELIAFMTVNPGASAVQVHAAFWPGRDPQGKTAASNRNGLATRTRRWLGNDPDGSPYFPHVGSGGYRLHPDVTTDWHVFRALVGEDVRNASTSRLRAALELVDGQPIGGVKDRYYGWAEVTRSEMLAAIGDACHELSERLLERGDPHAARVPAALGREVDPVNETCWRDALLAELGAGDRDGFERIVAQLTRRLDEFEDGYEPEDETQVIIDRARTAQHV